jgi:cell division transport system permease protein
MKALRHYLELHRDNFLGALRRLAQQPFASTLTILVIAVALALPTTLRVVVNNVGALSGSWQGAADFTVYLKLDVAEAAAKDLSRTIEARPDVSAVTFIGRDAALAEFRAESGFGETLDVLGSNPLPHTLVVRPASGVDSDVAALAAAIRALPETDLVQVDTAWVERLRAILALADRLVDLATVVLGLAVAIVVGNTIRLEINNRSVEIEVTKLVGGTDAFIRRPFLYLGLCYGLGGSLVAAIIVSISVWLIGPGVRGLADLYGSSFALRGLALGETAILLAGGALLGWLGAGLAAARHLRAIEPR